MDAERVLADTLHQRDVLYGKNNIRAGTGDRDGPEL